MIIQDIYSLFLNSNGVSTDTRSIVKGELYVALKGDNFDGNQYALQALDKGASYAIVDAKELVGKNDRLIIVADTLTTLQELANHHRNQLDVQVIAITGTNGKTTTKELLNSVLDSFYEVYATKGNFNNHIGVPLTLLKLEHHHEYAIIEMGASAVGEIKLLCEIAEPDFGCITNVGEAHLEGFGSFENIKKAKGELYDFLHANNKVIFLNDLEVDLKGMLPSNKMEIVAYGESNALDYSYKTISVDPARVSDGDCIYESNLSNEYNIQNVLTAITIGRYFKVPPNYIQQALSKYKSNNNRSQRVSKYGKEFFLDAYNANPTSLRNVIDSFKNRNALFVLGDMLELGTFSNEKHIEILEILKRNSEKAILIGSEFSLLEPKYPLFRFYSSTNDYRSMMSLENEESELIIIKGSRGLRLEELLD